MRQFETVPNFEGMTPEDIAVEIQSLEMVLEQEKILNPLEGFIPNAPQEAIIRAIGDPGKKKYLTYLIPASNSLGKTGAAIAIIANVIWGPQNRWFDLPRFREWPKDWPKTIWFISEQTNLKDNVCGTTETSDCEVRKWFPKGRYKFLKGAYDFYSDLTTDTGWSLVFKTYDQETKKFAGKKISIAVFDEPPPEAIFNEVLARLMTGGIIIMPMTPLYSAAWTAERLTDPDDVWMMPHELCDIEQNCRQHGTRGFLDHDQIQAIIKNYDPDERAARVKGEYMYLIGLVYKNMHPQLHRHFTPPGEFDQEDWKIYSVIDPHTVKPDLVGWFGVNRETGHLKTLGEYPSQPEFPPFHTLKSTNLSTKDVIERMKAFEKEAGWDPALITRVMDPNYGHTKKGDTGLTTQEYFKKIGKDMEWPVNCSCDVNDDLDAGHRIVREYLAVEKDPQGQLFPRLQVGDNCPNMWYGMTHYKFRKDGDKKADLDGPSEKVEKRVKDVNDLIRYFAIFHRSPGAAAPPPAEPLPEHYGLYGAHHEESESDWRNPEDV